MHFESHAAVSDSNSLSPPFFNKAGNLFRLFLFNSFMYFLSALMLLSVTSHITTPTEFRIATKERERERDIWKTTPTSLLLRLFFSPRTLSSKMPRLICYFARGLSPRAKMKRQNPNRESPPGINFACLATPLTSLTCDHCSKDPSLTRVNYRRVNRSKVEWFALLKRGYFSVGLFIIVYWEERKLEDKYLNSLVVLAKESGKGAEKSAARVFEGNACCDALSAPAAAPRLGRIFGLLGFPFSWRLSAWRTLCPEIGLFQQ